MLFDTNKNKGRTGLAVAIGYYGSHGYTVSIPLNDTQAYDLIVDKDNTLSKVQVRSTSQRSEHDIAIVNLFSSGGTNGKKYQYFADSDCEFLFVLTERGEMYHIPKTAITARNSLNLGHKYQQYRVDNVDTEYLNKTRQKLPKRYCTSCGKEISRHTTTGLCRICSSDKRYNHCRPDRETLKHDLWNNPWRHVCVKYGISYQTLQKWCDYEKLPRTQKEMNAYSQNEWENA